MSHLILKTEEEENTAGVLVNNACVQLWSAVVRKHSHLTAPYLLRSSWLAGAGQTRGAAIRRPLTKQQFVAVARILLPQVLAVARRQVMHYGWLGCCWRSQSEMLISELVTLPPCCAVALSHTLVSSFPSSCYVTLYPEGKKKNNPKSPEGRQWSEYRYTDAEGKSRAEKGL